MASASIGSSWATARTTPPRRRWRRTPASSSKAVNGRSCSTTASASTPRSAPGSAQTRASRARAFGWTEEGASAELRSRCQVVCCRRGRAVASGQSLDCPAENVEQGDRAHEHSRSRHRSQGTHGIPRRRGDQRGRGIDLVATLGSSDSLETLLDADIDVAVELTVPKSTEDNVRFLVEHDIDTVVGTTGWDNDRLTRLEATLAEHPKTAVLIAPNFSIGAVLAMRFAELAAPYFDSAEVVE